MSWTHLKALAYIDDPLKRDFYLQMCQQESWSTATAREITSLTRPESELSAVAKWCIRFGNQPALQRLIA